MKYKENVIEILEEMQEQINLLYKTMRMSNTTRNKNQKKWYKWRKRAIAVGVTPLKSNRPNSYKRKQWENKIIKLEKEKKTKGNIYIIKDTESKFYKVGFTSSNPKTRFSSIQTSNPNKLELHKTYRGNLEDEQVIHYKLVNKFKIKNRGEWYKLNEKAIEYIENFLNSRKEKK